MRYASALCLPLPAGKLRAFVTHIECLLNIYFFDLLEFLE